MTDYRSELEDVFSDTFKSTNGFRPRQDLSHLSDAELEAYTTEVNTDGWRDTLNQADAGLSWEAICRMGVDEIAHRLAAIRAEAPPESGAKWRLVTS